MKVKWSKHAHSQRMGIVRLIFREQTREIASKWNRDFGQTTRLLPPFPELGGEIPEECFWTLPPDYKRLRQTLCGPYQIVYEHVNDEIHILATSSLPLFTPQKPSYPIIEINSRFTAYLQKANYPTLHCLFQIIDNETPSEPTTTDMQE